MKWDWHYEDFGLLLEGPEMQGLMGEIVGRMAQAARTIAPVGSPADGDEHPGLYRDSFETETGVIEMAGRRAYGRLTNTAPYAAAVEYGNARVPAHHTMLRALDLT